MTLYDTISPEKYEARRGKNGRERYLSSHWEPILQNAIEKYCPGRRVIDLGCGSGMYTARIHKVASYILGVDNSKRQLSHAREVYGLEHLMEADVHTINLAENFDVAWSVGLLEYVNREVVMRNISAVLRPKGVAIILVPNRWNPGRILARAYRRLVRKELLPDEPSLREMLLLFSRHGYSVPETRMDDGLFWLPDILDKSIGVWLYEVMERIFSFFGRNPWSANMLFVAQKA